MSEPDVAPPPDRLPRLLSVGLLIVVVAAAVVRFDRIGAEDYWLDELHTLADSAGRRAELEALPHGVVLRDIPHFTDLTPTSTVPRVWRGMADDAHPPLYFVAVNVWRRWFGDGEAAVRSLSALCSLLAIVPVLLTFGATARHRTVSAAIILLAFSYADVFLAQQARPYALAMLFVWCATFLLVRMERCRNSRTDRGTTALLAAYALCLLGAMLTHYFAALPLIGHGVYVAIRFRGRSLRRWIVAVVAAAVLWGIVWGPTFLAQQTMIAHQPWLLERQPDHLRRTLLRVTDLPMRLLFEYEHFTFSATRSIAGAGLLLVMIWLLRPTNRGEAREASARLFALMYGVVTIAFVSVDVLGDRQMLAQLRYIDFALPGLIGMASHAVDRLAVRGRWIALAVFGVGAALTLHLPTQNTPDARTAAAVVEQTFRPGDVLIYEAVGWPAHWASRMYAEVSYHLRDIDPPFVMLRDLPSDALCADLRSFDRLIIVSPRPGGVLNPLRGSYELARAPVGYIDQVGWIYVFKRASDPSP